MGADMSEATHSRSEQNGQCIQQQERGDGPEQHRPGAVPGRQGHADDLTLVADLRQPDQRE